jgi:GNAT superfamily N-acetyltransferase
LSFTITQIHPGDKRLDEVIALWGRNRTTLGLFPRGAFDDCVAQSRLMVAIDTNDQVAGYITFRIQRRLNAAAIIHLCIREDLRGGGVSDALADWLKTHARSLGLSSLRLKCRRDYCAEKLWQRLGFVARSDVLGRGKDGKELTVWAHALGPSEDLFTLSADNSDAAKLHAVIDANVFFDLHGDQSADLESLVLVEPWVDDAVKLWVVDELHNEINRHDNPNVRARFHRLADNYPQLPYEPAEARVNVGKLNAILGAPARRESERSDREQLARSAAGHAEIFLTRDRELIDVADEIEAQFGVRVMYPSSLSGRLDEAERASAYQPVRLFSTPFTSTPLRAEELDNVVGRVQLSGLGEKPSMLAAALRHHLTQVRAEPRSELDVIRDPKNEVVALIAKVHSAADGDLKLSVLRVSQIPLARTLVRHLLLHTIRSAADRDQVRVVLDDTYISPIVAEAVIELGFAKSGGRWIRHTPKVAGSRADLLSALVDTEIEDRASLGITPAAELERRFWPAKVYGEGVSCYVVPIRPGWATHLFDEQLAAGDMFGAFAHLALNRENVYYRRVKNGAFQLPARILWYVSKEESLPGTMAIRACSRLVSVEIDSAKALFSRHRRLGIYEWRDVLKTAEGVPTGQIMALRFADTENFTNPVGLSTLQDLGITSNFPSPTAVSEALFSRIYELGISRLPA